MSDPGNTISDLMANIENYRPIPQGRDIAIAASASKGVISNEDMRKFESELIRFSSNPNARLKTWIKYLDWFDQTHPSGSKEAHGLYKRALNDVVSESVLENSSDVVTVAFRLALLERKPRNIFDDLYSKRKCIKVPSFWVKWAQLVEQSGDIKQTRKIFEKALSLTLDKKEIVEAAFKNFQERQCCEALQHCDEEEPKHDSSEPSRAALSNLHCEGSAAPVDRASNVTASSGLGKDHSDSSKVSKRFTIIRENPSSKPSRSLGLSTEGALKVKSEKENEQPLSKFKNESLKRGAIRSESSAVGPQLVIPEMSDHISNEELFQEIQDLKVTLTRQQQTLDRIEQSVLQNSSKVIQDSVQMFFSSQNFNELMKDCVSNVLKENVNRLPPVTPALENNSSVSEAQMNSGGSSFCYNNATVAWEGQENVSPKERNVDGSDKCSESAETSESVTGNAATAADIKQEAIPELTGGAKLIDMTPAVKSFNPMLYKQFTPATPAVDDASAHNVSGFISLDTIGEHEVKFELEQKLELNDAEFGLSTEK